MNILAWILFGLVVGIVSNTADQSEGEKGIVGSILLGIVGALVGGFFANLIFNISFTAFNVVAFFVAVIGSLLLLLFGKTVRKI